MIESNIRNEIEEQIEKYLGGELSANEIDELWTELIQDDYYYDYLKTAASLKGLSEKKRNRSNILNMGGVKQAYLAAAVVIIAATLVLFNIGQDFSADSVSPVYSIELDYYRSAEGMVLENEFNELLISAISAANRGEVNSAISIIEDRLEQVSEPAARQELFVTAGSILYNSGNYSQAVLKFEEGIANQSDDVLLVERNYWYLGNTYFQLNRIDEAKSALENAYNMNGAYSRIAESYLKALSE